MSYSTFIGGYQLECANAIAIDSSGNAYITGFTEGYHFPTKNAFQPTFGGGELDAFVIKLAFVEEIRLTISKTLQLILFIVMPAIVIVFLLRSK